MAKKEQTEKKPFVVFAFACQDTVKSDTMFSLIHTLKYADFDYDLVMRKGCDLIGSRTGLVDMARKIEGATHIMFVDHDLRFFPKKNEFGVIESPVTTLLKRDKDIIGAPYNFRSFPLRTTAVPLSDISDKTQPYRCEAIATGFMLIKLSIFDKIPKPWFNFGRNAEGEMVMGEDAWLCQKAKENDFEVWADPTLQVNHIGDYLY